MWSFVTRQQVRIEQAHGQRTWLHLPTTSPHNPLYIVHTACVMLKHPASSLVPRLSVPDFSPKLRDKIRNGEPGNEATQLAATPYCHIYT